MSRRKKPEPIYALQRFIEGIYAHFVNKGMPSKRAKIRMHEEVYDSLFSFIKNEEEVPDHILISTMKQASRHLNHRGYILSQKLKDKPDNIEELRKVLLQIKETKEIIDSFITDYKGDRFEQN